MKLIDKDALVEKIKQRLHKYEKEYEKLAHYEIWITAKEIEPKIKELKNLLSFIDTLETKEFDLEKEYDNEFFKDPVFSKLVNRNAGISIAKHFFKLGIVVSDNIQKRE